MPEFSPRGVEYRRPVPCPELSPNVNWTAGFREKLAPFGQTAADALHALLIDAPADYCDWTLTVHLAKAHEVPIDSMRGAMLALAARGDARLLEKGTVWCSPSAAPAWPELKARALSLLTDENAPPLAGLTAIAEKLGCSPVSAATATFLLCEQDETVFQRYAAVFTAKPAAA